MLLSLEKYFILESNIKTVEDFSLGKKEKADYDVDARGELYENSDDQNKYRVVISITFGRKKGTKKNSVPYTGFVKLAGFINVDENVPDEKREKFLMVNGLSLLYGSAREHVAAVTSRGPWEMFFLPMVSFRQDEATVDEELTEPNT